MKKNILFLVGLIFSIGIASAANQPALLGQPLVTIFNLEGEIYTDDIAVRITTEDGAPCYENGDIDKFQYKTTIMPHFMVCPPSENDRYVLYVHKASESDWGYQTAFVKGSTCKVKHQAKLYLWRSLTVTCEPPPAVLIPPGLPPVVPPEVSALPDPQPDVPTVNVNPIPVEPTPISIVDQPQPEAPKVVDVAPALNVF